MIEKKLHLVKLNFETYKFCTMGIKNYGLIYFILEFYSVKVFLPIANCLMIVYMYTLVK